MCPKMLGHNVKQSMGSEEIRFASAFFVQSKTSLYMLDWLVHSDKSVWSKDDLVMAFLVLSARYNFQASFLLDSLY